MQWTLAQLAAKVGGRVAGDDVAVAAVRDADRWEAGTVAPAFSQAVLSALPPTSQGALLVPPHLADAAGRVAGGVLVHDAPPVALARLIALLAPQRPVAGGVHPGAQVAPDARLGAGTAVEAGAVVGPGVRTGRDCWIGPRAVVAAGSVLGDRVRVGPGAVIGHDGFGFVPHGQDIVSVPQVGWVEIGDDVDIGANTCIDRGTLGPTVIGPGTKIDNLVQIGHNCRIGSCVLIAAQCGIAGSTRVGDRVMVGGQAGIADHLTIGDGARIAAKSGVIADVPPGAQVAGYPAMPRWSWMKAVARLKRLR